MINFRESPKRVSVGGWVRYLGLCPKKQPIFWLLSLAFVSVKWLYLLSFALLKNTYFFLDQIPGYSTGSITKNEKVFAAIIQQRQW